MPRKRKSEPALTYRFRDPRTGKFTKPKARKELEREEYFGTGKRFSLKRGKFKSEPRVKRSEIGKTKVIFEGHNKGERYDTMIAREKLVAKLARSKARRVVVEMETYYKGSKRPIRRVREIMLATKGKHKSDQNRIILVKTLIHSTAGTGLKTYALKFVPKRERSRYNKAERTTFRILAVPKGSRYKRTTGFEDAPIRRDVKTKGKKREKRSKR